MSCDPNGGPGWFAGCDKLPTTAIGYAARSIEEPVYRTAFRKPSRFCNGFGSHILYAEAKDELAAAAMAEALRSEGYYAWVERDGEYEA